MSNISSGNAFEHELVRILGENGFWAHRMNADRAGAQPCDIIAAKDWEAYLIDAKVCNGKSFRKERIEENQRYAMERWKMCGNGLGLFAVKFEKTGHVYMITLYLFDAFDRQSFDEDWFAYYGQSLEEWLNARK